MFLWRTNELSWEMPMNFSLEAVMFLIWKAIIDLWSLLCHAKRYYGLQSYECLLHVTKEIKYLLNARCKHVLYFFSKAGYGMLGKEQVSRSVKVTNLAFKYSVFPNYMYSIPQFVSVGLWITRTVQYLVNHHAVWLHFFILRCLWRKEELILQILQANCLVFLP